MRRQNNGNSKLHLQLVAPRVKDSVGLLQSPGGPMKVKSSHASLCLPRLESSRDIQRDPVTGIW